MDVTEIRFAFESCKSYTRADGSVSRNDFASICRRYNLHADKVLDGTGSDSQGKVTLDSFIHYVKKRYNNHYYEEEPRYSRPMSPSTRPHSASHKLQQRQAMYTTGHHYQSRHSLRYASPTGPYDRDDFTPDEIPTKSRTLRPEMNRTPDYFLSPETDSRRLGRLRPPEPDHTHVPRKYAGRAERSERSKSLRGGDTDDGSENEESFYPPPEPSSRRSCRRCKVLQRQVQEQEDNFKAMRTERERLEQNNERLRRDIHMAHSQNSDLAYAQLYRENDKLRQENKRLRIMDTDPDRTYLNRQYEDLKKAKDDLEEELHKEKMSVKSFKKECVNLRQQYNNLKLKSEDVQRANWQLVDENQKLLVKLDHMLLSRKPGDGGSEEHSARSSFASELAFQRTPLRHTFAGKEEVTRDTRPKKSRPGMKRTSSADHVLDYDEPPVKDEPKQDDAYSYSRAKSHRSAPSEASDGIGLPMATTTPDEQSQVFMVLNEDVSKSVLPEGLPKESELALIYALQNCHSVQDIIKCLVSYGVSIPGDRLQGFQVENDHLKSAVDHLRSKNTTLAHSFENAKANTESMYQRAQIIEANNTRLLHALKLCQLTCDAFELLFELRPSDPRHSSSYPNHFPSFDYSSLESSTRSPDREQAPLKHSLVSKARSLLHTLDSNTELQNYLVGAKSHQNSGDYTHTPHWARTLSQNTGTTSGLSSMSGGLDGEVTASEVERLKQYTQALMCYYDSLILTLVPYDGLRGVEIVKKSEMVKDCLPAEQNGGHICDLEDAANAEELCKVREEKAELRSQIYMMEQDKRRMELEVSRMLLHKQKCDRLIFELQFQLKEEKRKRKRERKGRKPEAPLLPPHDPNHMSELSIEYQSALEREKELMKKYDDLFSFLQMHIKDSQDTSEELMRFVKELRRANSALVDAFEKSKKRQQAEKRRMKHELVTYINRFQGNSSIPTNEEPTNGTIYA